MARVPGELLKNAPIKEQEKEVIIPKTKARVPGELLKNTEEETKDIKINKKLFLSSIGICILLGIFSWIIPNDFYTMKTYSIILNLQLLSILSAPLYSLYKQFKSKLLKFISTVFLLHQIINLIAIIFGIGEYMYFNITSRIIGCSLLIIAIISIIKDYKQSK